MTDSVHDGRIMFLCGVLIRHHRVTHQTSRLLMLCAVMSSKSNSVKVNGTRFSPRPVSLNGFSSHRVIRISCNQISVYLNQSAYRRDASFFRRLFGAVCGPRLVADNACFIRRGCVPRIHRQAQAS